MDSDYGYGLWWMVAINSLVFIIFAANFFHPKTQRDWRALGDGYPLTMYLLSGWPASWTAYAANTPCFFPHIHLTAPPTPPRPDQP